MSAAGLLLSYTLIFTCSEKLQLLEKFYKYFSVCAVFNDQATSLTKRAVVCLVLF